MSTDNIPNKCVMGRVMRQKRRFKKDFYVKDHNGSWEAARKAARRWEKAMEKNLPAKIPMKGLMTSRNRSGIVGVRMAREVQNKPDGRRYVYWRWAANWPDCPHHGGIRWSMEQYSDEDAFVLAVLARRLESLDRRFILSELQKVKGTEEYHEMLSVKKQSPP